MSDDLGEPTPYHLQLAAWRLDAVLVEMGLLEPEQATPRPRVPSPRSVLSGDPETPQ